MIILCSNTINPTFFILIQMNRKLNLNKGMRKVAAKDMKHKLFVGLKDDLTKQDCCPHYLMELSKNEQKQ